MSESDVIKFVANSIKALRTAKGMSQKSLAKSMGASANTISRWETGVYKPNLLDLQRLARSLGCSIGAFLPVDAWLDERIDSLVRTARQLSDTDLGEVQVYAEYRLSLKG